MKAWMLASGGVDSNSYIVYDDQKTACAIVDPSGDFFELQDALQSLGLSDKAALILLTHGHFDHISLLERVRDFYNVDVLIHQKDAPMLTDARRNLSEMFGMTEICRPAECLLKHGDEVKIGTESLRTIHTPGHTPGSACFYADGILISGDTLFESGVGRTDFPGGSMTDLIDGIEKHLLILDDDTMVFPGHGGPTTIGREKQWNPFLRGGSEWSY